MVRTVLTGENFCLSLAEYRLRHSANFLGKARDFNARLMMTGVASALSICSELMPTPCTFPVPSCTASASAHICRGRQCTSHRRERARFNS
eukprot:2321858-Rhodomonas_salina.1